METFDEIPGIEPLGQENRTRRHHLDPILLVNQKGKGGKGAIEEIARKVD